MRFKFHGKSYRYEMPLWQSLIIWGAGVLAFTYFWVRTFVMNCGW